MQRDLLNDPYGRFFHLSRLLGQAGHEVHVALMSYRREPAEDVERDGLHWSSRYLFGGGTNGYIPWVDRIANRWRPDWIIGFSDTYFGILAEWLGRKYAKQSLIDAYDNFEGYLPWCLPLHQCWRRALRSATALTAAGPALLDLMCKGRKSMRNVVVPMAVDSADFVPLERSECRLALGLPPEPILVGYFGTISEQRGISTLFRAIESLQQVHPSSRLVLSGRVTGRVKIPQDAIWLGQLPAASVPKAINAMSVVAVVNKPSKFGNYSYPIKLYEAMRCGIPVVATSTPATEWILEHAPDHLVNADDPDALSTRLQLLASAQKTASHKTLLTWEQCALSFEGLLRAG